MCKGNKIKDGDEMTEGPVLIKEVLDLQVSGVPNRVWGEYYWMLSASFILVITSLLPSSLLWEPGYACYGSLMKKLIHIASV